MLCLVTPDVVFSPRSFNNKPKERPIHQPSSSSLETNSSKHLPWNPLKIQSQTTPTWIHLQNSRGYHLLSSIFFCNCIQNANFEGFNNITEEHWNWWRNVKVFLDEFGNDDGDNESIPVWFWSCWRWRAGDSQRDWYEDNLRLSDLD